MGLHSRKWFIWHADDDSSLKFPNYFECFCTKSKVSRGEGDVLENLSACCEIA
jgi:hypothetical protein